MCCRYRCQNGFAILAQVSWPWVCLCRKSTFWISAKTASSWSMSLRSSSCCAANFWRFASWASASSSLASVESRLALNWTTLMGFGWKMTVDWSPSCSSKVGGLSPFGWKIPSWPKVWICWEWFSEFPAPVQRSRPATGQRQRLLPEEVCPGRPPQCSRQT